MLPAVAVVAENGVRISGPITGVVTLVTAENGALPVGRRDEEVDVPDEIVNESQEVATQRAVVGLSHRRRS